MTQEKLLQFGDEFFFIKLTETTRPKIDKHKCIFTFMNITSLFIFECSLFPSDLFLHL